jgi:Leucine-rich repeat (LRR) protein
MITGVSIEEGAYGLRAVLTSAWTEAIERYLRGKAVAEIELNHAKGWRGNSLDFLAGFPDLRAFKIIDLTIASVEPIHFLRELRLLEVITYCKTELRFVAFPLLEECGLEWRSKAASLFECGTLKKLFVNRYSGKDVEPFGRLKKLESLAILNAPIENVRGLSELRNLRSLRLANLKRLTSLAGIEGLANLEELEIHTCRGITSIAEIGHLSQLRQLHLNNDGDIASLRPLEKLTALESVLFYESTNIVDGDLSPLMRQKNLTRVSFQNRRHYSHRREDFGVSHSI